MTHTRKIFGSVATLLVLGSAIAAGAAHAGVVRQALYGGIGVSRVEADFDNVKAATTLDGIAGFNLSPETSLGRLSAEINYSGTISQGKTEPATANERNSRARSDFSVNGVQIMAVYRTAGPIYLLGTGGYCAYSTNIPEVEDQGDGGCFGGGIGLHFDGSTGLEATYTQFSKDLSGIALRLIY